MAAPHNPYGPSSKDELTALIKRHMHLIEITVERMVPQVPSFLSRDDMTSAAMTGLIDAANRFDREKGVQFKTFAEHRIRGSIYDEMRKQDWFSRTLREKHTRLCRTLNDLEHRLGHSPNDVETARAMDLSLEQYHELLSQVSHLGCVSLFETLDSSKDGRTFLESLQGDSIPGPVESLESLELTHEIAGHLKKLSEKERLVITLYYYEELTQKEIAEILEVSEGRISQLHSQALAKLKMKIGKKHQ